MPHNQTHLPGLGRPSPVSPLIALVLGIALSAPSAAPGR